MEAVRRVAFLCLGVMGGPMAAHLARAGHRVTVYNRTLSRAEEWLSANSDSSQERAGSVSGEVRLALARTPADAARGAEVVFACTGADPDLEELVLGPQGALAGMDAGSIFVDHTTASASLAKRLEERLARSEIGFLDAPVSGGQAGAENGQLTIMVGGKATTYERVTSLLDHYAKKHLLLGPAGSGQLTKMVNQICIAGLIEALAEGLQFSDVVGLDSARVVEVISEGAAGSWQMANRAQTMIEGRFDFGFAVDWMRKDLSMALEEGARHGISLPVTEQVDALYAEVQRLGGGRLDTSSLLLGLQDRRRRGEGS